MNFCKYCKKINHSLIKAHNYYKGKKKGDFFECKYCQIIYQPKKIYNLYSTQDSSNYNLNKNIFYYLKKIILFFFIFNIKKYFNKKKKNS